MNRSNERTFAIVALALWLLPFVALFAADVPSKKPNILWFVVDDMSANFSCYGEKLIQTPHVDRLAREGTQFTHAFVTAPVCSPCRSALITGMYQTSIGAHHHRSGRGELKFSSRSRWFRYPCSFGRRAITPALGVV